ncbi:MAG: hypothetical protein PVG19_01185 [Desulfobacterales bacterium]|jgi:hypothetical protein
MEIATIDLSPRRISDLVDAKRAGAEVTLKTSFEILPVDFHHKRSPFQAYIFLAKYAGAIDESAFAFRKCYARGCPNNLCTHVSIAVQIANRYLQRDYHALTTAGIPVVQTLFSLDDMVVKFERLKRAAPEILTLHDLVAMAQAGEKIRLEIGLEILPAVEHFARHQNAQTFLSGEFKAQTSKGTTYTCHRCFACYATHAAEAERPAAVRVANARLNAIYREFDQSGIDYKGQVFT